MGIKKNFAYNIVLTMSSYIVSLIVFPYVARVFGVELLGRINFANNLINYFSLFSLMGVSAIGIREISACGDDREKRSKVFSSILAFILLLTFISMITYIIAIFTSSKLGEYKDLLVIGAFLLFFTSLLIEWLYQGTEQFKYISRRAILVRVIYAISIFVFVKDKEDFYVYYILTIASTVVNAIINIFHAKKYVDFKFKYVSLFKYAKEILSLGVYKILTAMYTTFNVVYLGIVTNDIQVGYYTTSTKLFYILLGVLTAFTSVMLPRMSALISTNKKNEFLSKINNSFNLVFIFTIPIIIWTTYFTPEIIFLLSGSGYEGAIMPMRIITPMLFVTGIAQICVIQILMPLKKDKIILYGSIVGASVGILANILLVKENGAIGSALTLLLSEICGDVVGVVYIIKNKVIKFPTSRMIKYIIGSIPYIFICIILKSCGLGMGGLLFFSLLFYATYFMLLNVYIMRNSMVLNILASLKLRKK